MFPRLFARRDPTTDRPRKRGVAGIDDVVESCAFEQTTGAALGFAGQAPTRRGQPTAGHGNPERSSVFAYAAGMGGAMGLPKPLAAERELSLG